VESFSALPAPQIASVPLNGSDELANAIVGPGRQLVIQVRSCG
jgi:hypothetical protein